ncbi:MAG: tRNA (adenosine(37)-N6)-dimethylallyltransferase MiaA [Gammaproteobacteria bacterium]
MGPTASGKTAMAVEMVQRKPLQIISVDSAQVYRGMDIGTGKPDRETLRAAPHRLLDIRDPAEPYSASEFRDDALREIAAVVAAGDTPLLVGGTMLYFKALRDGLAALPQADPDTRGEIEELAAAQGWERVHAELARVDPESARRIHPNDPQRLQRALEVYLVSGQTMTEIHSRKTQSGGTGLPWELHFFAIQPPDRGVLHERIGQRFGQMLDSGLVEEVRKLHRRDDLNPLLPSIKSVGYRQVWQYLEGQLSYDGMVEKSIIATRQLAKRQLTWLRSWEKLHNLNDPSANSIDKVLNYLD